MVVTLRDGMAGRERLRREGYPQRLHPVVAGNNGRSVAFAYLWRNMVPPVTARTAWAILPVKAIKRLVGGIHNSPQIIHVTI